MIDTSHHCILLTSCPDLDSARRLARAIVESRAAACVSITGAVESLYHWQGSIENAMEFVLICKTTRTAAPRLEALIGEHHPYQLPEILLLPASGGSAAYLDWITAGTQPVVTT